MAKPANAAVWLSLWVAACSASNSPPQEAAVPHDSGTTQLEPQKDASVQGGDARTPNEPTSDAGTSEPELSPDPFTGAAPWLTRMAGTERLTRLADLTFSRASQENLPILTVQADTPFQSIDGFGASLTDSSAWLLSHRLSEQGRRTLLARLFDPTGGIGLNMLRQPMGASDFAVKPYSYDDTAPDLSDFSIDYERTYMLPVLKEIHALSPTLKLIGTPWSPPAWMKTGGKAIGGTLLPEMRALYADYFVRFLRAYRDEGLPFWAVTPQNEPAFEPPGYPGMTMSASEQAEFVGKYLGPGLADAQLGTKIMVWDHNWNHPEYPLELYADQTANAFAAGAAFHCYEGQVSAQTPVHEMFPDKDLWLTECSGGEWVGDDAHNFTRDMRDLLVGATRNWAKSVIKWNLALDQDNGPTNGGCTTCYGTVRVHNEEGIEDQVELNSEYYAFGHLSKFLSEGARRVDSAWTGASTLDQVAFVNESGARVLLLHNAGPELNLSVQDGKTYVAVTLPEASALTLYWGAPPPTLAPHSFVLSAATSAPDTSPALAADGDPSTRWSHGSSPEAAWFQIDLGKVRRVSAITLDGGISGPWYQGGYELYASESESDPGQPVVHGDALSGLETIRFARREARYLRVLLTGNPSAWSISELQVHP
jgi:glucosylceramidase